MLVTMNRKLDCHQISPPSGVWSLGFIKFSRVTLFSGFFHTANVDIDNDHLVLNYFLADYDIERIRHPTGISFDQMEINTDQALDLAERNGGEKLRGIINNQCFVSFYIDDNSEYWGVDYDRTLADKLLCFDVEFRTGEINSVAQRGSYPCQYFGLSGD